MKIVIPSHNRYDYIKTLDSIPESYYKNTYIVVRTGEQEKLYSSYKDKLNVVALDCHDISSKRDLICRHFANEKIWMVDDDCTLFDAEVKEYENGNAFCRPTIRASEESFYEFIEYSLPLLDKYPHGIVLPHIFPKGKDYMPYKLNVWGITNAMLNLKILTADDLNYTYCNHSEDVVAFLSVIDKGYHSFCLAKWMIRTLKPGKPGGITDVRTTKMVSEAAIKINKRFPKHTGLKEGWPLADGSIPTTLIVRPKKPKNQTFQPLESFME